MPEHKTKIPLLGQNVLVAEVPILKAEEKANEYTLEDGSVIRFRAVATAVLRLEGQYDADGNPVYLVKNGQVVTVMSAPENLRRKGQ